MSFHGPVAWRAFTPYTLGELRRVLCDPPFLRVGAPPPFEAREGKIDRENRVTTLVPGKARGRLPRREPLPDGATISRPTAT